MSTDYLPPTRRLNTVSVLGFRSADAGEPITSCPYSFDSDDARKWQIHFHALQKQGEVET